MVKMKCINCSKRIGLIVFGKRLCDSCKEEGRKKPFQKSGNKKIRDIHKMVRKQREVMEEKMNGLNEEKRREEKIKEILEYLGFLDYGEYFLDYKGGSGATCSLKNIKKRLKNKEITKETVEEVVEEIVEFERALNNIKSREKKYKIIETAEKDFYGHVKKKRISIPKEMQEYILNKFNHECSICGAKEGLHIHHKDHNPKNNKINNLIVLCGVCHKKIHMKVR